MNNDKNKETNKRTLTKVNIYSPVDPSTSFFGYFPWCAWRERKITEELQIEYISLEYNNYYHIERNVTICLWVLDQSFQLKMIS
jgi:hypothetical protein